MKKNSSVIMLVLAVLLMISCFLNIYLFGISQNRYNDYEQYYDLSHDTIRENEALTAQKDDLLSSSEKSLQIAEEQLKQAEKEKAALNEEAEALRKDLAEKTKKADAYEELYRILNDGTIYGYGDENFRTSEGILLMKAGDPGHTISLTTGFENTFQIDYTVTGESAEIFWNEETWSGTSTTFEILPSKTKTGTTVFEIRNSLNNTVCKVCAVVVPAGE